MPTLAQLEKSIQKLADKLISHGFALAIKAHKAGQGANYLVDSVTLEVFSDPHNKTVYRFHAGGYPSLGKKRTYGGGIREMKAAFMAAFTADFLTEKSTEENNTDGRNHYDVGQILEMLGAEHCNYLLEKSGMYVPYSQRPKKFSFADVPNLRTYGSGNETRYYVCIPLFDTKSKEEHELAITVESFSRFELIIGAYLKLFS